MSWPIVAVKDVAAVVSGATPKSKVAEYWGDDVRWATPTDLSKNEGAYLTETARRITHAGLQNCAAQVLPPRSVLMSSRAPIGLVAINTEPMATNQGFKSLVPDRSRIFEGYLYHWLAANTAYLQSLGNGATFKEVSKAVVQRIEIPLPPLEEQRRIAGILDAADALRRRRREALALLGTLPGAIFAEMFGDRSDLPTSKIEDVVVNSRTGPFGSQLLKAEFVESGIPVLGIDNVVTNQFIEETPRFITEQKYKSLQRYTVLPGDVLITIMGTCGRCAVVPDRIPTMVNTKHLCCLTPKHEDIQSEFLRAAFLFDEDVHRQLEQQTKGSIMAGLNMGIIKGLSIKLPPISEQESFAARLRNVDSQIENYKAHSIEFETLFASLQSRAFAGEL